MKNKKKILLGITAFLMLFLCACGNAKRGDSSKIGKNAEIVEELAPEYSYVAEYLQVPEKMEVYHQCFLGNRFYGYSYELDQESGDYEGRLMIAEVGEEGFGPQSTILSTEKDQEINSFCLDGQGNLYVLFTIWQPLPEGEILDDAYYDDYYKNTKYHLAKYDDEKKLVYEEDITERVHAVDFFYATFFAADDQGNCCIYQDELGILLFDKEGKYLDTLKTQEHIMNLGIAKDGNLYCSSTERSANGSKGILQKIDFEQKCLGTSLSGFQIKGGEYSPLQKGITQDILYYDQEGIYEYSLEKQETTRILSWMDLDIDPLTVRTISVGEKEKIYVLLYQWNGDNMELAALKKVRTEEIVRRENITIGLLFTNTTISSKVVEFNKKSEKYHVSIKTYLDLNEWSDLSFEDAYVNLKNDLLTGDGPDIIDLQALDIRNLVEKGVLEDLRPYLKKSEKLSEKDFFPKLIDGATIEGKLAYLSSGFALKTMVGRTSDVGVRMGWTVQDLKRLAERNREVDLWQNIDKMSALQKTLSLTTEHFMDYEGKSCHFDSREFQEILEFANSFPKDRENDMHLQPLSLQEGSVLLADAYIYDFEGVGQCISCFGGDEVTFVGYPRFSEGNGCVLIPSDCFGMSALSEHKEDAFTVIEEVLLADPEEYDAIFQFSSKMEQFEKQKEAALAPKYVYDMEGNLMMDDNGDPMLQPGNQYQLMGENGEVWEYVSHPVTQEEVELVEKLMADATFQNIGKEESEIEKIIQEEAGAYFSGSKSVKEVMDIIQDRVSLYLKEKD